MESTRARDEFQNLASNIPCKYVTNMTRERATYLCTNSRTVDSHCAVRPFRGMPPLVSSTGHTASRSCQTTTNSWLVSIFQTAVVLNHRCVRKQRKADLRLLSYSSIPASYLASVVPFVESVGTASCCTLRGPDSVLSPLRWTSTHLHCCMENTEWSSRWFVPFLSMLQIIW